VMRPRCLVGHCYVELQGFVILAAANDLSGACDTAAQTSVPTVTSALTGLATPLTSTITNCMMATRRFATGEWWASIYARHLP
jgi:hypothetical protein